jgi:hypothetical protein
MNVRSAAKKVDAKGALLVFPVNNRKDIPSLWNEFYPRSKMNWEWDESGDSRLSDLWHLREKLSVSRQVVYCKWFRGRATLLSQEVFVALIKTLNPNLPKITGLSFTARELLDLLTEDSPISTKELKRLCDLRGREREAQYQRAMKELWSRGLIVAFGEVDEGAFPSLAIGATEMIFEDLFQQALLLKIDQAQDIIDRWIQKTPAFYKYFLSLKKTLEVPTTVED